jgi:hypothetical protein
MNTVSYGAGGHLKNPPNTPTTTAPPRRRRVEIRSEGHHQDVGVVGSGVGHHPLLVGVDGDDGLLVELDAGDRQLPIGQPDFVEGPVPEHHVELRESEDERVGLVDQCDVNVGTEALGQPGGQFQTAEPGAEDYDSCGHAQVGCGTILM